MHSVFIISKILFSFLFFFFFVEEKKKRIHIYMTTHIFHGIRLQSIWVKEGPNDHWDNSLGLSKILFEHQMSFQNDI